MARPLRIAFPGAYYHVINRGLAQQRVFTDRADRQLFLGLLADCHDMWGLRVLAYCLLDNHYHLLLQTLEGNLARVMRHLDGVYTQRYNRRHGRDGPLFRGRYTAIVVERETYLLAVARYIHQNPVAAGLVRSPEVYRWSSCHLYVTEAKPPAWLETRQLLSRFPRQDRRTEFLVFMKGAVEQSVQAFYENQRRGPVLGSGEFLERIRTRLRKRGPALTEVPEAKAYLRPEADACLQAVEQVYHTKRAALLQSRRGRRNEPRALAMYACRRLAGMQLAAIARLFGVPAYSTISSVVSRTAHQLGERGAMARRLHQVRHRLQR
jgi:REP element-mobilizing transposase RayT